MIVIPSKQIVLVTPPKTGSSSAYKLLCEELKIGFMVEGPQGNDVYDIGRHTCHIPHQYHSYDVLCLNRDPKERFVSLYKHYCRGERRIPFEKYVEMFNKEVLSWFYMWPVKQYKGTKVSITTDFLNLGVQFPKINVNDMVINDTLLLGGWF